MQSAAVMPPDDETEFAGQGVHVAEPVAVLNVPAGHFEQEMLPSGPVKPALHVQAEDDELPAGELDVLPQSVQGCDPLTFL
jgi:hypothetical protein